MKEFLAFYTWKNLNKSFWISLFIVVVVCAVFFNFHFTLGLGIFLAVLTFSGPGIMAHDVVIREEEKKTGMDRL